MVLEYRMDFKGPDSLERRGISWGVSRSEDVATFAMMENPQRVADGDNVVVTLKKKEVTTNK